MAQTLNDVNDIASTQLQAKQVWATPVIETYDVAAFTQANAGVRTPDTNQGNIS